jgi:hypothetical protein
MKMKKVLIAALIAANSVTASLPPITEVALPTYTASIADSPLDWSTSNIKSVSLPRFDPAIGVLRSVTLTFRLDGAVAVAIENLDNIQRDVQLDTQVKFTVQSETASVMATTTGVFNVVTTQLAGFDGVSDFQGPSAYVDPDVAFTVGPDTTLLLAGVDNLDYYIGAQPMTLGVTTRSLIYGTFPDNVNVRVSAHGALVASVTYTYVPRYCEGKGTATLGYWKNHPNAWPVNTLVLGKITYTKAQLLAILKTPVKGDKTVALAHQLIAAKLNVHPSLRNQSYCIIDDIAAADALLSISPVGSKSNVPTTLIGVLDDYNNGRLCAPHRD